MSRLQAVPFVLNALQMKSNLRAPTIRKSPRHWSANQTLIRKMMIVLCMWPICLTIGQASFLIPPSDNLYTSACLHLQNVNMPEIKLKQVSVKKTHLSHHYWQKINWLTFLSTKSAQKDLIPTTLCQQALSNTQCMMENIIKSNICHASDFFLSAKNSQRFYVDFLWLLFVPKCQGRCAIMLLKTSFQSIWP